MTDAVSALTHELLNQLTIVDGFARTLAEAGDTLTAEQRVHYAEIILRNTERMMALLRAAPAAAEPALASTGRQLLDLVELVHSVLDELAGLLDAHSVDVSANAPVEVTGDGAQLRRVVTNLVSNAVKFSPRGTSIRVSIRRDGKHALVEVADEGPGVPAHRASELFERYSRLGRTEPGQGLGLFISRQIARAHGGDVELAPSDAGARFWMRLPVSAEL